MNSDTVLKSYSNISLNSFRVSEIKEDLCISLEFLSNVVKQEGGINPVWRGIELSWFEGSAWDSQNKFTGELL